MDTRLWSCTTSQVCNPHYHHEDEDVDDDDSNTRRPFSLSMNGNELIIDFERRKRKRYASSACLTFSRCQHSFNYQLPTFDMQRASSSHALIFACLSACVRSKNPRGRGGRASGENVAGRSREMSFWLCNERKRRSDALFFQISLVTIAVDDRLVSTHCLKDCVNHRRVSRSTRRQLSHRLNGWVRIRNEPTLIYMRMYVWATFFFLFVQAPVSWSHPVCVCTYWCQSISICVRL